MKRVKEEISDVEDKENQSSPEIGRTKRVKYSPNGTQTSSSFLSDKIPIVEKSDSIENLVKPLVNPLQESSVSANGFNSLLQSLNYNYNEKYSKCTEEIKQIKKLLVNSKEQGRYSSGGEAHELPIDVNLYVNNYGQVTLPLNKQKGEDLVKICSQAPFGLNLETIVDKKVRDTFQLNPDQFEIRNTNWNHQMSILVRRVAQELGCNCSVEAKIYKLLLYKKGGHFLKHMDTEKEKNMFGTLVIQLPSEYEGGDLVVYDGSNKTVFDFGKINGKSKTSIHYAAHYSDIEHEVLKVTKGFRLALVYSLCWELNGRAERNRLISNPNKVNGIKKKKKKLLFKYIVDLI